MLWSRHLLILISLGLFLPQTPVVQAQGTIPSRTLLNRYGLELLWSSRAVINPTRDKVEHLVLDEESVYVQTRNGFVTAFDSQSGIRRWAQLVGRIDTPQLPLTSNSDTVLVTSGVQLFALDKWTGTELWEIAIPEAAGTSPVIDEDRVFIASQLGSVFAFDLRKIYELYHQNRLPQWSHLTQLWRHKTSRPIEHRPILYDDQLTFVSQTGILYSVLSKNDQIVFQQQTDVQISAPMIQSGPYLYVATEDNQLYCLDKGRGTIQWDFITRDVVRNAPVVINNRLYLTTADAHMYCINATTGSEHWIVDDAKQFVAKTDSYVVCEDSLRNLVLLAPDETGTGVSRIASLPFRGFRFKAQNSLTDRIYMVTSDGLVVCMRERGQSFPKFFKHPERRPIEPVFVDESELAAPAENNENP
jgi:outer membrane protein assembly factor BamB